MGGPLPRRRLAAARRRAAAFTIAELLVVMAIITVLAASLAVVLPRLRTRSMVGRADADIQGMAQALAQYHTDIGYYPVAPFPAGSTTGPFADDVLRQALTNRHAGGTNRGWGAANAEWGFIHEESVRRYGSDGDHNTECRTEGRWVHCDGKHQFTDPWGGPYYYIAHPDYVYGVRVYDPGDETFELSPTVANYFGTTPKPDDYQGTYHEDCPDAYRGPPPEPQAFFNPTTFQIHSKGPDQLTDLEDGAPEYIDACDRGTDPDDINNW